MRLEIFLGKNKEALILNILLNNKMYTEINGLIFKMFYLSIKCLLINFSNILSLLEL